VLRECGDEGVSFCELKIFESKPWCYHGGDKDITTNCFGTKPRPSGKHGYVLIRILTHLDALVVTVGINDVDNNRASLMPVPDLVV
jgi:hypothetical protein